MVQYRVYNTQVLDPNLDHINRIHILQFPFLNMLLILSYLHLYLPSGQLKIKMTKNNHALANSTYNIM
jgi:hypothetical protein